MTFVPAPSYTKEDLVACGNGDLFGPNNGRLPADEMLMFDSIDQIDKTSGKYSNGKIIAHLNIEESLWFFKVHFKSDPVMPGCLGLDAMWQLLGFYLCWLELPGYGRALGSDKVKFFGQVTPNAKIVKYEIDIKLLIEPSFIKYAKISTPMTAPTRPPIKINIPIFTSIWFLK